MTTVRYDLLFYIQLRKVIYRLEKYHLVGAISVVSALLGLSLNLVTRMKGMCCGFPTCTHWCMMGKEVRPMEPPLVPFQSKLSEVKSVCTRQAKCPSDVTMGCCGFAVRVRS